MKTLLIGSGGREHTLAWKLSQSSQVDKLFVTAGNGGMTRLPKTQNVEIAVDQLLALRDFALQEQIDLTVVGPEAPLAAGIVDLFQAAGLHIFGPSRAAARLEGSKAFAKEFMLRHAIPTARSATFTDYGAALRYLDMLDAPPVVKASGLAAGKGVILPTSKAEAAEVIRQMLIERQFGEASATVLLEERLSGLELSVLAFCDGKDFHIMPPAQDHKRVFDNDKGPNTGGMGAFTPTPQATPALLAEVAERVISPTLRGMAAEGSPYVGVLYAGLMLTPSGIKVLEFNCRLGDPETQVVLPLLASDLVDVLLACIDGKLPQAIPQWHNAAAVSVVMAAAGYPGDYSRGQAISGLDQAEAAGCFVFQAGTTERSGKLLTGGGRVLAVTALGKDVSSARRLAYAGVEKIHFAGAHYRRDIGE